MTCLFLSIERLVLKVVKGFTSDLWLTPCVVLLRWSTFTKVDWAPECLGKTLGAREGLLRSESIDPVRLSLTGI